MIAVNAEERNRQAFKVTLDVIVPPPFVEVYSGISEDNHYIFLCGFVLSAKQMDVFKVPVCITCDVYHGCIDLSNSFDDYSALMSMHRHPYSSINCF